MFCYTTVLSGVRHLDVHISSALPSFETQFESPGGDFTSSLEHEYHNAVKSVISLQSCRWDLCAFLSALFSACPPASLSTSPSAVLTSHHRYFHSPLQTPTYSSSRVHYNFSGSACAGSSFPFSISDWEIQDFTQSVLCPNSRDSIFTQEK